MYAALMSSSLAPSPTCKRQCFQSSAKAVTAETKTAPGILHAHLELRQGLASPHLHGVCQRLRQREPVQRCRGKTNILLLAVGFCTTRLLHATSKLQSLRDRLSLSVLEDGSRKAERLENFLVTSNSTVQKFLYWDFLANILPSRFLLPMPTVSQTTYRATTVL